MTPTPSDDEDQTLTRHPYRPSFFQLNCHNRFDSTMSVLNTELTHMALLLQEPWTNPYDWLPPTHQNWHRYTPRMTPTNRNERSRACIYINKSIPSHQIHYLPDNNDLLCWVTINNSHPSIPKITLLSLYNTPTKFDGLLPLQTWLNSASRRDTPTFIMTDSNLHHRLWNPPHYSHTHPEAKNLIKMCGKKGFTLISPKQVPTGRPTTIDLTWANHIARHLHPETSTRLNNHSSDHQPIITKIQPPDPELRQVSKHLSIAIGKLDHKKFLSSVQERLNTHAYCPTDAGATTINQATENLTDAFCMAFESQGKWVNTNQHRTKPWWNATILNPLVKERNGARREMLKNRTQEATLKYYHHQETFKQKVWELKTSHWRKFLADKGPEHAFQAYNITKNRSTSEISALKTSDGHVATDIAEKATILFEGTSLIPTEADLCDVPPLPLPHIPPQFPPITEDELTRAIKTLPNKKAAGPDKIPNELLKIANTTIVPHLVPLFNTCLLAHHFPAPWKRAITVIIKKAAKEDYTDPNAYRPIALLNTLGKLFEKIINDRLTYWADQAKAIHPGHVGGRSDVKSAYPTVHKRRLIHSLIAKNCPQYLYLIIDSFLTDRTTRLRLDQYTSHVFNIPTGLPQGSPLSVTLYLLYNSDLLIPGAPSLARDNMSLAYVDDVTHLLAANSLEEGLKELDKALRHSQEWGLKHGAIFDKNKTNLILFTKRRITPPPARFGDQSLTFKVKVKWLGITLTPTLTFGEHLKNLKQRSQTTLAQLSRIIKPTYGLHQKEARTLVATILTTRILHGSILWYTNKNAHTVAKLLNTWHHKAIRLSTGMMRQTPIAFLKHYGNVPDFTKQHTKLIHNYVHAKLTGPTDDPAAEMIRQELPYTPPSHPSPLNLMIRKEDLLESHQTKCQTILTFPNPPWARTIAPIFNTSLTKELARQVLPAQVKEEVQKGTLTFFSDGSLLPRQGGGAAAKLVNTGKEITTYVGKDTLLTNFKTELMALLLCQVLLQEHINTHGYPTGAAFFSDNQMALASVAFLKKKSAAQQLQLQLHTNLQYWAQKFPVRLYWCPGHAGIPENERVDKLAKLAAESQITSHLTINTISLSKLRQTSKDILKDDPLTREEMLRINFRTPPKLINKALDLLEKGPAATIDQLRTNHVPLNDYLHRIKRKDSPNCQFCSTRETPHHYLIKCPAFDDQRRHFTQQLIKHKIKLNPKSLKSILDSPLAFPFLADFIIASNRFQYIRNYLPPQNLNP
ncbi:hypothetical protein O181_028017 [Austropuccinia psidii MF-1]|uniref:RNase H type-1 domain-containing protein n=1 Tax=Austropuccinia psidii MF-1 TaxID=1389203 RepID=A0A9Q3CR24_9BASI|nr:hypothetical protein [Austropuccinia psidii MF-1]